MATQRLLSCWTESTGGRAQPAIYKAPPNTCVTPPADKLPPTPVTEMTVGRQMGGVRGKQQEGTQVQSFEVKM